MDTRLNSYLRHLGSLSVALGCAGVLHAAEVGTDGAADDASSIERLLAQGEVPSAGSDDFAVRVPWAYQAWPESTWRQYSVPRWVRRVWQKLPFQEAQSVEARRVDRTESLSALLDDIRNEA
jgi:hypothetical protein